MMISLRKENFTELNKSGVGTLSEIPESKPETITADPFESLAKTCRKVHFLIPLLAVFGVAYFVLLAFLLYRDYNSRIYSHCVMEAGDFTFEADDFLKNPEKTVTFDDGFVKSSIDTKTPGDYPVRLKSGPFRYNAVLTVEDTVAPQGLVHAVSLEFGESAKAEDFVKSSYDVEEVSVRFEEDPDFEICGTRDVNIVFYDPAGNETVKTAVLSVCPFKKEITWEAGEEFPSVEAFEVDGYSKFAKKNAAGSEAVMLTDFEGIDVSSLGSYDVAIEIKGDVYHSKMELVDTVKPEAVAKDFKGFVTSVISPQAFVKEAKDATELTYEFVGTPDFKQEGTVPVTVKITDCGGNSTEITAKAVLAVDKVAPVIRGVHNIFSLEGRTISYKTGVSVTDNCDKDISFSVDSSAVDYKTAGVYPIVYTATDRAGNTVKAKATVTVSKEMYTQAQIDDLADKVLAKILTPGMSDMDKLTKIYYWVRNNTRYQHATNHSDYLKAAYTGFTTHTGDCYVYASQSKALLDRAGIKNMMIDTYPLRDIHFWNLVDIGEGWRHFDTVPRQAGGIFLYWDDATITAYSNAHGNSHIYDRNRFPAIP